MLRHLKGTLGFPVTQRIAATHDGEPFKAAQLRCAYLQADSLVEVCLFTLFLLSGCHTCCKC